MAPAVVVGDNGSVAALGASGGRRIMSAVLQIALNLGRSGMTMQPAVAAPRIDASTPKLFLSPRLGPEVAARLGDMGHPLLIKDERLLLGDYASPACALRDDSGAYTGGVDPYYYPATAVGVD
jgi:gamma-glutamyltranspeptidase/glutathione hydrolase